ncbi:Mbeg1-like protein [Lactobacillus porci]|uniref:Mbeg1-like protein n=1 Tax=Lactobacillus porci TaxID=2012477 RepID=UPI003991C5EF
METGSNLTNYLEWRQTHDLPRLTVTVPDGMVLSELCYLDFAPVQPIEGRTLGSVCRELLDQGQIKTMGLGDPGAFAPFIKALATSRRFAPLIILRAISVVNDAAQTQFAAMTFLLPGGDRYIAFRGTDTSLIGWKENFITAFDRTSGQEAALAYVRAEIRDSTGMVYVGGHSKGGNLALYACELLPANERERVLRLDDFDGPGLCPDLFPELTFPKAKVQRFIPEYDIVGQIFESVQYPATIVKSTAKGIWQHDLLSWQIKDGQVVQAADTAPDSKAFHRWLDRSLSGIPLSSRAKIIDGIFDSLQKQGYKTLQDLAPHQREAFQKALEHKGKWKGAK